MKTEITEITPAMAKALLSSSVRNRHRNEKRVKMYADSMTKGEWKLNGETVKVSSDGRMIDGQHRMAAIIRCGLTIRMAITSGLPYDVFDTIDTGKSRKGGDVLDIAGVKHTTNIAAGINLFKSLVEGVLQVGLQNFSILEEYRENPEIYDELARKGSTFYGANHRIISPSEYIGYWRFFHRKVSEETIQSFFDAIENQQGVGGLLYSKLIDNAISQKKKLMKGERRALIVKAFVQFVNGVNVKTLRINADEKFPSLDDIKSQKFMAL